MVEAKRARQAETPKQPSLCLRLRAPQFYPDWAMVEAKRARKAETPKPPSFDLRSRASYFYPTSAYPHVLLCRTRPLCSHVAKEKVSHHQG